VSAGAFCALSTTIMANLLSQPRIYFAMARDGLLFPWFGHINRRFATPIFGTLFTAATAGLMAFLFDIEFLTDLVSIGTLMAFDIVCICVLLIRYRDPQTSTSAAVTQKAKDIQLSREERAVRAFWNMIKQRFPFIPQPSESYNQRTSLLLLVTFVLICVSSTLTVLVTDQVITHPVMIVVAVLSWLVTIVVSSGFLWMVELNRPRTFAIPFSPITPILGIVFNTYMMVNLPPVRCEMHCLIFYYFIVSLVFLFIFIIFILFCFVCVYIYYVLLVRRHGCDCSYGW